MNITNDIKNNFNNPFVALKHKKFRYYWIGMCISLIVGALLIIIGYTNIYLLTGIFIAITGFFFIIITSSANSTLQLNSNNEYRGRVMSVYGFVSVSHLLVIFMLDYLQNILMQE